MLLSGPKQASDGRWEIMWCPDRRCSQMGSSCIGTSEVVYAEVELTEIIVLPA